MRKYERGRESEDEKKLPLRDGEGVDVRKEMQCPGKKPVLI